MRAIDGDRLIDSLESAKRGRGIEVDLVYSLIQEGIRQLPTLSVGDLRPKGRWNLGEIDKANNRITIECPKCGMAEEVAFATYGLWRDFCPSCGADMRGGGEDA